MFKHKIFLISLIIFIFSIILIYINKNKKKSDIITKTETVYYDSNLTKKEFSDGLKYPDSSYTYNLDEFGEGISSKEIFKIDINNDGQKDEIIKIKHENATSHFYFEYKILLEKDNNLIDITPENFITIEGADCSLQKIQFIFNPVFKIIKISRKWENTWNNPSTAYKYTYIFNNNSIKEISEDKLGSVCDVKKLF